MKGVLEFTLPEEHEEFDDAQKGTFYRAGIEDLDNWLRGLAKYQDLEIVKIEEVRAKIRELLLP
jgi:hypothetical protein